MSFGDLRVGFLAVGVMLAGCAGGPPAPDWQVNAHAALAAAIRFDLSGDSRLAAQRLADARADIARSGRPDLIARAELVQCAARVASLEFETCTGFASVASDASAEDAAYARFLAGDWHGLDAGRLPTQHRPLIAIAEAGAGTLAGIEDPVSRLVAAGALFRAGRLAPEGMAVALDTASEQGWRRPLLAWLGVALRRAEAAGDGDTAKRLRRRIDLATGPLARPARP